MTNTKVYFQYGNKILHLRYNTITYIIEYND